MCSHFKPLSLVRLGNFMLCPLISLATVGSLYLKLSEEYLKKQRENILFTLVQTRPSFETFEIEAPHKMEAPLQRWLESSFAQQNHDEISYLVLLSPSGKILASLGEVERFQKEHSNLNRTGLPRPKEATRLIFGKKGEIQARSGQHAEQAPRERWAYVSLRMKAPWAQRSVQLFLALTALLLFLSHLISTSLNQWIRTSKRRNIKHFCEIMDQIRPGALHQQLNLSIPKVEDEELLPLRLALSSLLSRMESFKDALYYSEMLNSQLGATLKHLEEQNHKLEASYQRSKLTLQGKAELLTYISHELRTPLNSMIGFTQYLMRASTVPNHVEILGIIERSGKMLLMITKGLLDAAHLEAGKFKLYPSAFSPRLAFEEVTYLLASTAHNKGLRLFLQLPKNLPELILGDKTRIQQLVTNLVSNAIKFTRQGEVVIHLLYEEDPTSPKKGRLSIEVADTGPGLSASDVAKIFEKFKQLHYDSTHLQGSGLGLNLCRHLVRSMDGKMGVESELGEGSRFWIKLPVQALKPALSLGEAHKKAFDRPLYLIEAPKSFLESIKATLEYSVASFQTFSYQELIETTLPKGSLLLYFIDPSSTPPLESIEKKLKSFPDQAYRWILAAPLGLPGYFIEELQRLEVYGYLYFPFAREALLNVLRGGSKLTRPKPPALPLPTSKQLSKRSPSPQLLVVDDHPYSLRLIKELLQSLEVTPTLASSGEAALEKIKAQSFDLVIVDIHMPQMNGIELFQTLQTFPCPPPIVATTASASSSELKYYRRLGFKAVLIKPPSLKQLKNILNLLPNRPKPCKGAKAKNALKPTSSFATHSENRLPESEGWIPWMLKGFRSEAEQLYAQLKPCQDPSYPKEPFADLSKTLHTFSATATSCGFQTLKEGVQRLEKKMETAPSPKECTEEIETLLKLLEQHLKKATKILRALSP